MPTLTSARLKLDRAREHVEAAEECIDRWLGTDAYTIVREKDPKTGYTIARAKVENAPPTELSLIIGDAVQNFRSALDHAVYALAERQLGTISPEVGEFLMFPVVGNVNRKGQPANGALIFANLTSGDRDYLHGLPDPARAFIEREQPYHWNDAFRGHPLWVVHDLNRIDKHRRLTLTTAWLGFQYLTHPSDIDLKVTFTQAEGPVTDDDVLVVYSGANEGVSSHFTREVALNEPTSPHVASAEKVLTAIQRQVEWVVASLENIA